MGEVKLAREGEDDEEWALTGNDVTGRERGEGNAFFALEVRWSGWLTGVGEVTEER